MAATINDKQSAGEPVGEDLFQSLYELDNERKQLENQLEEHEQRQTPSDEPTAERRRLLRQEVGPEEIAEVVSDWTGVPVTSMMESEKARLLVLEERIHQRLVGQDEAVEAVANAVRRSRSGLQDPQRPIGSFLFCGPTGVGKTELCKALAEVLFDDEQAMVRLDMSEFMEKHTVSRLIGAPPGYVGYRGGGQNSPKPCVDGRTAVVLLDEIEKAHRDVFNILLQVLDDGRLTDNHGHTVDFSNTIIVMTSNVGSQMIQQVAAEGGSADEIRASLEESLQAMFLPEFLNRIDETIVFQPLDRTQVARIVELQLQRLADLLAKRGLGLEVTESARARLAADGYDTVYGARPVKRVIQQLVQNPLATELLRGEYPEGSTVEVDVADDAKDDNFTFRRVDSRRTTRDLSELAPGSSTRTLPINNVRATQEESMRSRPKEPSPVAQASGLAAATSGRVTRGLRHGRLSVYREEALERVQIPLAIRRIESPGADQHFRARC